MAYTKAVPKSDANLEFLLRDLPDQNGARLFIDRLGNEQPRAHQNLLKQPALLSDVLALAAWSPLLATTLEQNSEYLPWLSRERADPRVRTSDELKETLARFALMNSSLNPQVLLATLQKEEGLVDGSGPYGCGATAMASALGYGCTDSGTNTHDYSYPSGGLVTPLYYRNGTPSNSITGSCVNSGPKAGFSEQIIHAT